MWSLVAVTALAAALLGAPFATLPAATNAPRTVDRFAVALAVVLVLLYLNQVAFQVYVYEEHNGNMGFLGRRFPSAFFRAMAPDEPLVAWLRAHLNGAELLAPSVFRVQAVLELPFAWFAYLSVAALFDRASAQRLARGPAGVLACVAYTVVLCAIEELLRNQYTDQDLLLRGVGLALTVPVSFALAGPPVRSDPPTLLRLSAFFVGLGAMSVLVIGVNLIALLYNLGWLYQYGGPLLLAVGVFVGASVVAVRGANAPPVTHGLVPFLYAFGQRFVLLFAAPALAIRYAASRPDGRSAAALAMAIVIVLTLALAIRDRWKVEGPWVLVGIGGGLLGVAALVPVNLARSLDMPILDVSDAWFVQKAVLGAVGFLLGWALVSPLWGGVGSRDEE